jgi:signal peptidase I
MKHWICKAWKENKSFFIFIALMLIFRSAVADGSPLSSFRAGVIPSGYYFALGDNRDNSADSRVIGLVPRQEIVGRSRHVVLSFNYENYYIPRKDRFLQKL